MTMALPTRARSTEMRGTALVASAAVLLVLWSVVLTAGEHVHQPVIATAFLVLVALGEVVRLQLPGDREAAPVGAAGILAYALLARFGTQPTTYPATQVIALAAVAVLLGAVPHVLAGRTPRVDEPARRILLAALAAYAFRPAWNGGQSWLAHQPTWVLALVMLGVAVLVLLADAVLAAFLRADRDRAPYLISLRDELRAVLALGSAVAATGVLIALAAQVMAFWALPVFCVPLLLTQMSFRRYSVIRATYLQTIRSLSRVTELGGYTETGHAQRVSELSLAVGRELGMREDELLELEYAALMHDLGQLSLTEPVPGGATIMVDRGEQRRIAELGAAVIREAGVLDRVALVVARQADPYRRPHETTDETLPLASRIIKVVNAFEDLVPEGAEYSRGLDAIERLRLGMAYDYDPRVVETLARIVRRSGR
ncbi:MAG TPA: HD domain-containing phosphohydrolase [Actinomycetes bacterium]|nr:HD domain-containing phosphohydrolase [Actinomycetes bacterium]